MSDRSNRFDSSVTLGVTLAADLLLFPMIFAVLDAPLMSRAVSLVVAYAVSQILRLGIGRGISPRALLQVPGLWPLLAVTVLINFGLFVILNARAPDIRPILHLLLAWAGSLLFLSFGSSRIKRLR
ncbi:MAG: hypothetical protein KJ981_06320 [Alphaproteobacteria bacterium]|nr:hypothetical protein [Alphaproteobacteria bacterium]MBU1763499.1 hypothetical protein [Alphaproteobacteria bacterium]